MELSLLNLVHSAAVLLLLGNITVFPGLMMFWIRKGHRGGAPPNHAYLKWERGFIMGGILFTMLGFVLFQVQLSNASGRAVALIGAVASVLGGILGIAAEALGVRNQYRYQYPTIVAYVVLAFTGQALIGVALLQAGILADWIGWATVLWNLAWLVALLLLTPRDIYFPALHHVMPLVLGIALLLQA